MKKVFLLIMIVFLSFSGLSSAGFLDDIFKAVGDGIKEGVNKGVNQGSSNNRNKRVPSSQKQAYDEQRGVELYNKGIALREKGRHREAIIELEKAALIARKYNNTFGEMNCLSIIGLSYMDLNEYRKAIDYFKDTLKIAKRVGDKEREGSTISILASCYAQINDYPNAISYNEQKLFLVKNKGNKKEVIDVLDSLSGNYSFLGDIIKAISYIEQGLELSRELGNKQLEMEHLNRLGEYLNYMGNISKATHNIEQSLVLAKELNNKTQEANCLAALGIAYSQLGDYTKAIKLLEKSLKLHRETKNILGESVSLTSLGHIYAALEEYSNAIKYYEQSLYIAKKYKDFNIKADEFIGSYLAISYLLSGNNVKAEENIKLSKAELYQSLFYLLSGRPKDAVAKLPKEELLSFPKELFATHSKVTLVGSYTIMGLAYEALRDTKTSEFCFKTAIDILEKQRETLLEEDRMNFMGAKDYPPFNRLTPYEGLIRLASPEDAFLYSETIKARILLEQIAGKFSNSTFNIPEEIKSQEINFNNTIAELLKKQEIALKLDDKDNIINYENKINKLREKIDRFIKKLYTEYPEYAVIRYPKPLKINEIKLYPDEVLIEYVVTDSQTLGWLIKNGKIVKTFSTNMSRKELEKLIDRYHDQISNPKSLRSSKFDSALGYKLFSILMKDFLSVINPDDKIIIVPDKKLGLLPFEALVTKTPAKEEMVKGKYSNYPSGVRYLGDDYNISYYQSASALTMIRTLKKLGKTDKALFILSDPVFDVADARLKGDTRFAMNKQDSTLMRAVEDVTGLKLGRLDKTSNLSKNLSELFKGQGVDYLTGIEANESNLKKIDLSKYQYLVFATHGILDSKISGIMEPALVLNQVGNKEGNNGFLTMSKVMGLKLNNDIAALTACETGSGKLVSGEGVMGLGRAFQYAGAKSVLASLWSVAEDSTVKLVERFFYYQKMGKDRLSSLKMARNDIRKEGYEHPFFWAPFILIGEEK